MLEMIAKRSFEFLSLTTLCFAIGLSMPGKAGANQCRADKPLDRPAIGLALGGGGARGYAHLGVLRKLEELRVPYDFIAGTSMGSIVGGFLATGMESEEIKIGRAHV